jgi:hypothetical protein
MRPTHDTPHLQERDPHPKPNRFLGRRVSFDYEAGGRVSRLIGVVEAQRYTGRTDRGQIPDYELSIRGSSGKAVTVSLVESYASFPE